jgi:hypothetical protein
MNPLIDACLLIAVYSENIMDVLAMQSALESKSLESTAESTAVSTAVRRDPRKKEKRKGKRDPISGSLTILWGANAQEERLSRMSLIDLSAHGAKFRSIERIPPGSWLMFNYHLLGASGRGTVRYCQLVKSSYHIGVEFSGGTGWNPNPNRFTTELRNLSIALDGLKTANTPDAA